MRRLAEPQHPRDAQRRRARDAEAFGSADVIMTHRVMRRAVTRMEIDVIRAALEVGPISKTARRLSIESLCVVGQCDCGCDSVDFEQPLPEAGSKPIADAVGATPSGGDVGVIVWGTNAIITGLEIYDLGAGAADLRLPDPRSIRPNTSRRDARKREHS